MKRVLIALFALLSAAAAQEPVRLAVLAFDTDDAAAPYRFGLATGLQRSLNVIDNLYAPPIGDTLVVAQSTETAALDTTVFAEAFGAQALVSGLVTTAGDAVTVEVFFAEPGGETRRVPVEGQLSDPAGLLGSVVETVVSELGLSVSAEDQAQLDAVVAQTPPLGDLAVVSEAALGLSAADSPALARAAEGGGSWALSERAEALGAAGEDEEALALSLAAIQAAPEDVEALVNRGVVLAASGDVETARTGFAAALALNPAHAVALAGQARLSEDPAAAQRDLEAALAAYPRYAAAYLELASLEREAGSPQTALQTLRTGVDRVPESAALKAAFITEAVGGGNTTEAVSFLEEALTAPDPAASLYALTAALPAEESERALTLLREGRARYPRDAALALAEAEILGKTDQYAAAEDVLREAQAFAPDNLELTNQLALAQAEQGKTDAAAATLRAAAEQNPDLGSVLERVLAQIYLQAGENEAATETLAPLLEDAPEDAELHTLYGVALGRVGEFDRALSALDEALRLNPDDRQAARARRFVAQNQQLAGATRVDLPPEAQTALQEGITALEADDFKTAQTRFDRAAEISPGGLPSFYQGYARQLQGDLRGAVSAYDTALAGFPEANSGQATVLNNAGFAYFRLGRLDKAVDYLTRAVAADPSNSEAQLNLGLIYYDLGRLQEALGPLEAALAQNPSLAETTVNTGAAEPVPFTELLSEVRQSR
ncbi:MAG: hypothetical protein AVDCRST_MAG86-4166 [uncultured Truepera sp.]|uniref:Uncharacterized protein n=1 Tax=uncultured Truepera sp. TaxID=543023 RepID=A0A6J4VTK0_9DEIN|nr:MAG: hypothetical protein AVDCRST_MAG86-4166 [uncultured Truepera sp.]